MENKKSYSKIFIEKTLFVFKHELQIDTLKKKSFMLKSSPRPSFPIAVVIGFAGDLLKGQVVYSMGYNIADKIGNIMIPGTGPEEKKKLLPSAIGELVNMISGQASINLAGMDNIVKITPPVYLEGEKINFDFLSVQSISLALDSPIGIFEINIAFEEKK